MPAESWRLLFHKQAEATIQPQNSERMLCEGNIPSNPASACMCDTLMEEAEEIDWCVLSDFVT